MAGVFVWVAMSQSTFNLMCGRSRNAKLLKQDLLGLDDTSSFGNMIRE
jgi:hypothetical protein